MKKKIILLILPLLLVILVLALFYVNNRANTSNNDTGNSNITEDEIIGDTIYSYLINGEDGETILVLSNNDSDIDESLLISDIRTEKVDNCNSYYDESVGQSFVTGPVWTKDFSDFTITKVIIKNTLKPLKTTFWFQNLTNLVEIEGLEKIDFTNVTDASGMFSGCSSLTSLDLTSFDMRNVVSASGMFANCTNLQTIYVDSEKWNLSNMESSDYMFYGAINLTGSNGTKFDSNYIDKTYARIDTKEEPGYLSSK